ncbi:D-hexose-6-phosphate mutarotase [Actinomyces oricola]|uniref:D-hexose-6-phosphate mutarotase n=1 Tax=Actinomyces oricola TaxID=206043 RepID=UPI000FFEA9B2|nr:D-hexose-6-phosphate mutarotase [Actinomyces oricola]
MSNDAPAPDSQAPARTPRLPRYAALTPGRGGQPRLLVDAPAASAEIYLHGAHLTSWVPRGGTEVIFTSAQAVFDGAKAIRGGIPLCLPWFGAGPDGDQKPAHGWGRTSTWELRSASTTPEGGVRVLLGIERHDLSALYEVNVGEELDLLLSLRSTAASGQRVEAALHTYLAVGDVTAVEVTGLEGGQYLDKLTATHEVQTGALRVSGPVDRVYEHQGPVMVTDPALGRRLTIAGADAPNVVVWNPWSEGAKAFADMGDAEFASMLCVESASVGAHAVTLGPGESWSLGTRISVEPLD